MAGQKSKLEHPYRIGILMEEAYTYEDERAYAFKYHVLVAVQAPKVFQVNNELKIHEYDLV